MKQHEVLLTQEQMQAGTEEHNAKTLTGSTLQSPARLCFWRVAIKVEHLLCIAVIVVMVEYIWQLFILLFKRGLSVQKKAVGGRHLRCTGRWFLPSESLHRKVTD